MEYNRFQETEWTDVVGAFARVVKRISKFNGGIDYEVELTSATPDGKRVFTTVDEAKEWIGNLAEIRKHLKVG